MHLEPFELHAPSTVDEAVRLARELPGGADFLAGGTDLLPNYKMHLNARPNLIRLDGIPELTGRSPSRVGAMERLWEVERDAPIATRWPALAAAAGEVATPLVRASGTVGGNLLVETRCFFFNQSYAWRQSLGFCLKAEGDRCHVVPQREKCYATFSGDLAPALMVLGASIEIAGPDGRRQLPLAALYDRAGDGIRRHRLGPGELVVAVHLPEESAPSWSGYRKLRVRPAFDFPELGVAVAARWEDGTLALLRIATGGLETSPREFDEVTRPVEGTRPTLSDVRGIGEQVTARVRPVHNTFLPPDYRKRMTGVFVRRLIEESRRAAGAS